MNEQFLIPANSKKSMLIFSFFNLTDLIIFGSGCLLTFILLLTINENTLKTSIIILIPVLVTGMLVMPVPNHHNFRTLIYNVYTYFANRRTFFWKGWCLRDGK